MRVPRLHYPHPLRIDDQVSLEGDAFHYLAHVLRMKTGQRLALFGGNDGVFPAIILRIDKRTLLVQIQQERTESRESPLHLHLGQVIPRGEKMEFTVQKSVELGVDVITPLFSERSGVKLDSTRLAKKIQQWQKIAISACEQCGRNTVPVIREAMALETWCKEMDDTVKLALHPKTQMQINALPAEIERVRLLVGPEGGITEEETAMVHDSGFTHISLGPRVLRTETTALTAITALQVRFGDLG